MMKESAPVIPKLAKFRSVAKKKFNALSVIFF